MLKKQSKLYWELHLGNEKETGRHGGGMRKSVSIKEKKETKKAWDKIRNENTKKIYKEKKSKAKKAVAMAKERAYDNFYARLETKEGEKELYRLARQRDRARKDVQCVRVLKNENDNVMVSSKAVIKR